jgi:hypothetical protein
MTLLDRLLRRPPLPADVTLDAEEHVVARAATADGTEVIATSHGLWLPGSPRLGWHVISKATWEGNTLAVVAASVSETVDGVEILADDPVRHARLTEPGKVPEAVHRRVTGSIRSRHHRELPGGGAWFVQRAVPGRDGVVLQVRPDPGTDAEAVRRVTAQVARRAGLEP